MIHTVAYDSYDLSHRVDCLKKLKECKFNRILIPEFEFNVFRNVLTIHMNYIKGKQISPETIDKYKDIVYEDLVCSENPISIMGYNIENFIISNEDKQIYYIDLTDIGFSTVSQRNRRYVSQFVNSENDKYSR